MIYRLRKFKKRYGFNTGRCYLAVHFGKHSWYIPHHGRGHLFKVEDKGGNTMVSRLVTRK
jgi:hypothetical protein